MVATWRLRGLLGVVVVIGMSLFSGCGGDDNGVPGECVNACNSGCSRFVACGLLPTGELNACSETCVDALAREELATPQACQDAAAEIAQASCAELSDLLDELLDLLGGAPRAEGRGGEGTSLLETVVQVLVKIVTQGN